MAGSNTATATMCGHKALVYNIGEAQHKQHRYELYRTYSTNFGRLLGS